MGRSLGVRWASVGHEVFFGSSDGERGRRAAELAGERAASGTYAQAAEFGEVVLHTARDEMLSRLLPDASVLDGKTVLETNNQPIPDGFRYRPIELSFTEKLQADVPKAHVVKAFNTMAQEVFEIPPRQLAEHSVSVFLAGNDTAAKQTAAALARDIGFRPIDCGDAYRARLVEQLGDFIRWGIGGLELGAFATLSVNVLDDEPRDDLGGREASRVDG